MEAQADGARTKGDSMITGYEILTKPRDYIVLELAERKPATQVWNVVSIHHGDVLGVIKWFAPWRQYCFFPSPETIWNEGCIRDIQFYLSAVKEFRKMDLKNRASEQSEQKAMK